MPSPLASGLSGLQKLLPLSLVLCISAACGNTGGAPKTDDGVPAVAPTTGTDPTPTTGVTPGTEASRTPAYGVGLQVGAGYLARRGSQVVHVKAAEVADAIAAGYTLEATMLPQGKLALGDRCLALEAASSQNGTLRLQPCDNANVVTLVQFRDGASFTRLPTAGSGNILQSLRPDTSTCPVASADGCRVGYDVEVQDTITLAASPLAPKIGPRGTLLHAGYSPNSCVAQAGKGVALAACNANDSDQRWLFRTRPLGGDVNALLIASEAGDCLIAQGGAAAPTLVLGDCTTSTQSWLIIQSAIGVQPDDASFQGNGYFLRSDPSNSSVSLASNASSFSGSNDEAYALFWQIGPTPTSR